MYILWLVIKATQDGEILDEAIIGIFPPSNFWTMAYDRAKEIYFDVNLRIEFQPDVNKIPEYADKFISAG